MYFLETPYPSILIRGQELCIVNSRMPKRYFEKLPWNETSAVPYQAYPSTEAWQVTLLGLVTWSPISLTSCSCDSSFLEKILSIIDKLYISWKDHIPDASVSPNLWLIINYFHDIKVWCEGGKLSSHTSSLFKITLKNFCFRNCCLNIRLICYVFRLLTLSYLHWFTIRWDKYLLTLLKRRNVRLSSATKLSTHECRSRRVFLRFCIQKQRSEQFTFSQRVVGLASKI